MILLKKLRQERKLSIVGLANITGVNRSVISNIENKQCKSTSESIKKLAKYFGVKKPSDLVENVVNVIQDKSCLNQRCLLNKKCYCQSDQVIKGAYCQNEKTVSDQQKAVSFNNTGALFVD